MDRTSRANLLGGLRLGIGASLVVAPGFAGRIWIGPGADDRGARVFARAIGARDVLLGLRTIAASRDGKEAGEWLTLGYGASAADALATTVAFRNLSGPRRIAMPVIAGVVAALCYAAAQPA